MSKFTRDISQEFVRRYWPESTDEPKHERLRRAFANAIAEGYWTTGMRLPTEVELVSLTPCSLGTVQRALRALSSEGLIERRRGSGSIVADTGPRLSDPWHMRFLDPNSSNASYLSIETRVVCRTELDHYGPWSLPIRQGEESVVKIDRIFTIDGKIDVYAEFFAISSKYPELLTLKEIQLSGVNLKTLIANHHHAPVHKVRQRLRFEKPPAHVAKHGAYAPDLPIPVLNVVAFAVDGEPSYYQDFYLPLIEFELDLGFSTRL